METINGIRKEVIKGSLKVDKIYVNDFQKEGTVTVQIRQEVKTISSYPSKRTSSNLQSGLFTNDEFGFADQKFESVENRLAWPIIPASMLGKVDEVQARLDTATKNGACIYRVLSVAPILDDNQKYAISAGLRTEDDFANSQALRYPENNETILNGTANKLILDKNSNVQYRRTFYWNAPQADHDVRDDVTPYVSPELKAEMLAIKAETAGASVLQGQTL